MSRDRSQGSDPLVLVARVDREPPGLPAAGARYVFAADEESIERALAEAEILFAWNFASGDWFPRTFAAARSLRWIHTAGVGVEPLLTPELVAGPVVVTNSGGVYEQTMAEYAVMLMLQFAKDAVRTWADQRARVWNRRRADTLEGRTVLIVGAGAIGRRIARLCRAFEMETIGVARTGRPGDNDFGSIHAVADLPAVLPRADYVVLVAPLTPATQGLIGRRELDSMKPGARLLNLGRGALVDESALLGALREGRLAGAALDVYREEPLPPDHELWAMPNVIVSPHMSGDVADTHARFVRSFLDNLDLWRKGLPLRHVVDKRLGFRPSPEAGGDQTD